MSDNPKAGTILAAEQQTLNDLWEEHVRDEFAARDTEATLRTMAPDAYVNHVPVMTGGVGHSALREFYSRRFIPQSRRTRRSSRCREQSALTGW